jgi:hypothetical protein
MRDSDVLGEAAKTNYASGVLTFSGFAQKCTVSAVRQTLRFSRSPDVNLWLTTQDEGHGSGFRATRSRLHCCHVVEVLLAYNPPTSGRLGEFP